MKACKECPFRKTSLRGWLGTGGNVHEYLAGALGEYVHGCHLHNNVCRGAVACANKSAKRYRDPELAELQKCLPANDPEILNVLEFLEHHTI